MNVAGIGAHYDDLELGCSGTLMKHVQRGDKVTMIVVTDSAYSDPSGQLIRPMEVARAEGQKAASLIGADLICLDYKTFEVPFDEGLSSRLEALFRKLRIDTIYIPWIHDIHRDHQNSGKSAMMAGRHIPRFLMYRPNFYESDCPFRGKLFSDITDVMDRKIEVIKAHASELERVRYKWLDFFVKQNANDGQVIGVPYAESFEVVRYLL